MITPTLTQLDKSIFASAEAANHFATTLRASYLAVWEREPSAILEELNADVARSLTTSQLLDQCGTLVNTVLDTLNDPRFSARAILGLPTGYAFDGTQFTYTPPATPEPE